MGPQPTADPFALPEEVSPTTLRRPPVPRWRWYHLLVLGLVAITGTGLFVLYWQPAPRSGNTVNLGTGGTEIRLAQFNCRFLLPEEGWESDGERRKQYHAVLALQQRPGSAWVVLIAEPRRENSAAEEDERYLVDLLNKQFGDALEWQRADPVPWLGADANRVQLRIDQDGTNLWGEAVWMVQRGVLYALLVGTPGSDLTTARNLTAQFQERLSFLRAEKPEPATEKGATRRYSGHRVAYQLEDRTGRWEEWKPAQDFDPWADLAIVLRERGGAQPGSAPIIGTVLVLLPPERLPNVSTALDRAQQHLLELHKKEYPETTIQAVAGPEQGSASSRRLHVRNGETRQRLVLQRAEPWSGGILILQAECDWRRRETEEAVITTLVNSFRLSPAEATKSPEKEHP